MNRAACTGCSANSVKCDGKVLSEANVKKYRMKAASKAEGEAEKSGPDPKTSDSGAN